MEDKESLSDIYPEVDGTKPDDIIEGRKFKGEVVRRAAERGNPIALQAMWLDAEARLYGIDSDYNEALDDEDSDCL